jgi:hypothetical protein
MPSAAAAPDSHAVTPSSANVAITRTVAASSDRMPRPVDDTVAPSNAAGQKPIIRNIEPRTRDDASDRPVDIMDLPKNP